MGRFASISPSVGGNQFYGVTAQVLPVLFVILTVEFSGIGYIPDDLTEVPLAERAADIRAMPEPARSRLYRETILESIYTTAMMVSFCTGEILALASTEAGVDSLVTRLLVWISLGCGAGATVFPPLAQQYQLAYDQRQILRARTATQADALVTDGITVHPWIIRVEGVMAAVFTTGVLTAVVVLLT